MGVDPRMSVLILIIIEHKCCTKRGRACLTPSVSFADSSLEEGAFFLAFSVYAISRRDFSKVSAVKKQYLPLRGRWLPKGRRKEKNAAPALYAEFAFFPHCFLIYFFRLSMKQAAAETASAAPQSRTGLSSPVFGRFSALGSFFHSAVSVISPVAVMLTFPSSPAG